MSTSAAPVDRRDGGPATGRPQWLAVARSTVRHVVVDLAIGLGVTVGLATVALLLLWFFVVPQETSDQAGGMWSDAGSFTLGLSAIILALVLVIGGLAVVVTTVTRYTRVWLAAGATRRSVWAGHWAAVVTVLATWAAGLAAVLLAARFARTGSGSGGPSWSSVGSLDWGYLAGGVTLLLTALVVTLLFVRFGAFPALVVLGLWWIVLPVGLSLVDVPQVVAAVLWPPVAVGGTQARAVGDAANLWTELTQAALLAVAHGLIVRRMPAV